jgi:hypothetical protein
VVIVAHTLIAILVTVIVTLVTGWLWLGWAIGASIYMVREFRQMALGKGYGTAAWAVPFAAASLTAIGLSVLHWAGILPAFL